ncbi:Uncharacterised protein [uncultured archaeon]|nr:Uncharacterised protein [uncultured archaeon]
MDYARKERQARAGRPVLFGLVLALLLFAHLTAAANSSLGEYGGVWFRDARLLTIGGQGAVWVWMGRSPADTAPHVLEVGFYNGTPAKQAVLLDGPWAGGRERMGDFAQALKSALAPAGWRLGVQNLSTLTASPDGRVLILPAGAWPRALMERWNETVGPRDLVVYLGALDDQVLQEDGGVRLGGVDAELRADGQEVDSPLGGRLLQTAHGSRVWRIGHTLNEYENLDALAGPLMERAVTALEPGLESRTPVNWGAREQSAVVMRPQGVTRPAQVRLVLRDAQGNWQRVWDAYLPAQSGELDGPAQVNLGGPAAFQVRLQPGYSQTERLRYRAVFVMPNQSAYGEQELGEGSLQPGGAWLGSFTYRNWSVGGDWRVDVRDQFERTYAAALVHVVEYRLQPLPASGSVQRLSILRDGQVMQEGTVRLRLAGHADWSEVSVHNGVVSFAAEGEGAQAVQVEAEGVTLQYTTDLGGGGPWAAAWRWGLPALLLAGILYLVLKPKSRAVYRIRLLEQPPAQGRTVRLGAAQWMDLLQAGSKPWNGGRAEGEWVLRAEEAAELMQRQRVGQQPLVVSLEAAQELLDELVRRGRLAKWREWYGPAEKEEKRAKGGSGDAQETAIRRRALERQLHDRLVEAGIRARPVRGGNGLEDAQGRRWQAYEPHGGLAALEHGRLAHALVFADAAEQKAFMEELGRREGAGAERIRLSLRTGRLKLVKASDAIETAGMT